MAAYTDRRNLWQRWRNRWREIFGIALSLFVAGSLLCAQETMSGPWVMQVSGTSAGLRGIHAVGGGMAWASGTDGTILRTEDSGYMWQSCAMPPGAEKLDFRGIWAWDENTAMVMSSGPGDLSRIYKTTDGCSHWTLLFTNPDKDGFWDAMVFWDREHGLLFGDPVHSVPTAFSDAGRITAKGCETFKTPRFLALMTNDGGIDWGYWPVEHTLLPDPGRIGGAAFAASNSSAFLAKTISADTSGHEYKTVWAWAGIGGKGGARVFIGAAVDADAAPSEIEWSKAFNVPLTGGKDSSGIFSVAFRLTKNSAPEKDFTGELLHHGVAVGGDYEKPNEPTGTAAWTSDGGQHWTAAAKPPHGYRSAVAWDADARAWIAVGTNGSDISYDDGKTWIPLDDGNWNALSLPWVVGSKGRIAKLDPGKLPKK